MATRKHIAKVKTQINVPVDKTWDALVNPQMIKKYMFGTSVNSDWVEGSKITWKGEWKGKPYEDKGVILHLKPNAELQYSHFSPLSGLEDKEENYHIVTIHLKEKDKHTSLSLTQDNNASKKEQEHSEKNWDMMLMSLKKLLEESSF
ncbi:ATPase [Solitalea longa]|uniref:ATPase n=1 Tax=Solitalea longa TaxID=2079460 RepID=A0A2S5A5K5_9SPHI|nr:SRPBCC family protein [Solitalea longa]POY37868.1 ATPase [Solitalea longa]